jgi:hypothetical protein
MGLYLIANSGSDCLIAALGSAQLSFRQPKKRQQLKRLKLKFRQAPAGA